MRAGRLREQVTIEKRTTSLDAYGGDVSAWATLATVWAAVEPVSVREQTKQGGTQQVGLTRFIFRYQAGIALDETCRLVHDSIPYAVDSVINDGQRDRQWTVTAIRGTPGG